MYVTSAKDSETKVDSYLVQGMPMGIAKFLEEFSKLKEKVGGVTTPAVPAEEPTPLEKADPKEEDTTTEDKASEEKEDTTTEDKTTEEKVETTTAIETTTATPTESETIPKEKTEATSEKPAEP